MLKEGFVASLDLSLSIDRRHSNWPSGLTKTAPTCKAIHLMFGDLIVMEHYITKHDRQTEVRPESLTEQSDDEVELENMFNEICIMKEKFIIRRLRSENDS